MSRRRVVITGLGVVTSLGETVEEFWDALISSRSGIRPITRFDAAQFTVHFGGECTAFDPERYCNDKRCFADKQEIKKIDRFAQFGLVAGAQAVSDSGIDFDKEDPDRAGVIIGSGIGGIYEIEDQHKVLLERGPRRVSPYLVPKLMVNAASGQLSIKYGLRGPCSAVATACASAGNAIGDAFRTIIHGEADVMVTGGSEAALTTIGLGAFCALRALSTRNDAPEKASRPFDKDRDGFILSEGAGIIVLEELEHARKRGAKIYAEMLGYGTTGDGCHITQPDPDGKGAARAMAKALGDAALAPDKVGYINAHGTSTPLGDAAETKAVKTVFGAHAYKVPVSSTKSAHGHLLGASGGVELVATALALKHNCIPPTLNLDTPDEGCDLDYVPHFAREARVDYAMSNSFGFGGHNVSLLIGRI
jgi:3-oxoacyl-[acyl-carrier-protein] synthase II